MNLFRKKKLFKITGMLIATGISVSLILYTLRQNISLYYTPTQLSTQIINPRQLIRVGGFVASNSMHYFLHSTHVEFAVTDHHQKIVVDYDGLLPELFRVGQGAVAQGYLHHNGVFYADQVLAKHGVNYHGKKV